MGKSKLVFLLLVIIFSIITPLLPSEANQLICLLLIYLSGIAFFRFELLYPFVWVTPFILLYNVSIVILSFIGLRESSYSGDILFCTYLSEITLFISCLLFIKSQKDSVIVDNFFTINSIESLRRYFKVLGIVLLLYIPFFFRTGFVSKAEVNLNGGLPGLEFFSVLFKFFFLLYLTCECFYNKKFPVKDVLYAFVVSASISVFIGERDIMLTVVLFSFFVFYFFFKPSTKKVAVLVTLGILLVPISSQFKQVTNSEPVSFSEFSMIESLLGGEFFSSGRNIETLMENKNTWSFQYGAAIPNDILRSLLPSRFLPVDNSTSWFNHQFNSREDLGFGIGFSYLGEGYLQAGYAGVILWTILLSFVLRILYNNSRKSVWGLSIYIYMMSFIIYSMRGDLSYVLSPLIKHVLIAYILCVFLLPRNKKRHFKSNKVYYLD